MPVKNVDIEKFGEVLPQLETVLSFGIYTRNLITNSGTWSKGVYHILGLENNAVEPTIENLAKYVVPEDVEETMKAIKGSFETKKNYNIEFSIVNAGGIHKRLYAETWFKQDDNGVITEYNGVLKDITESYEYKQALEDKVQQLDKSNRNLQEFVYVASHDLQEPVRKISTFAERLSNKYGNALGEEGNTYLRRMLKSSDNMQTLLEDLLNFSRLSFNDTPFEKVSLLECFESAISDLDVKIEETKAIIEYNDLPAIEGHFTQLKQLFNNLIGNAIKFRKQDETPHIKVSCTRVNPYSFPKVPLLKNTHYARIEISDNGIGFEAEFSERIFMIFQRLNSRAEYSGSGIGLSICKKIAENHQGHIYANSALNIGSSFTVLLPYTIS